MSTDQRSIEEKADSLRRAKAYPDSSKLAVMAIDALANPKKDEQYELNLKMLHQIIKEQAEESRKGDKSTLEETLICQAKTLDVIFNMMVSRAARAEYLDGLRAYMDIALRAQGQARKTLLALDAIKYPAQRQIVGQQNIALNQQVNNGGYLKPGNELLEVKNEQRLDTGKAETTIKINPPVEAVEAGWCKKPRRKSHFKV